MTTTTKDPKDLVFKNREDAELVRDSMRAVLVRYKNVSREDLYDLSGIPTTHEDRLWGWTNLDNIEIKHVVGGYVLDLPPAEEITNEHS